MNITRWIASCCCGSLVVWLLISALLLWHAIRHAPDESELWRRGN